ncbi:hypothetical protein LCGC14_1854980 [marine sediment metagenome]|uniref:Uncharacterized protein n=1 Tax=marine sediment metagenome TaxID=412755 RepID=A0A0F9G9P5_9ZZZZ
MNDLKSLIAELERAKEGSRELDWRVYAWFHAKSFDDEAERYKHKRHSPNYTTRLDAEMSGENITKVEFTKGRWFAWTDTGEQGEAATEPLARRISALKALEDG